MKKKSLTNIKQLNTLYDKIFKTANGGSNNKINSFHDGNSPLKREFSAHLRQNRAYSSDKNLEKLEEVKSELLELKSIVTKKILRKKKKFRKTIPQDRGRKQKKSNRIKPKKSKSKKSKSSRREKHN